MDALPSPAAEPYLTEPAQAREIQSRPVADPSRPADPLRDYLARHDEPCPHCGYNLRGVEDSRCPECGHAVRLAVQGATARSGYLWFLLLALGWVLAASGMNAARYGRMAYQEARSSFTLLPGMSVRYSLQTTPSGAVLTYGTPSVQIGPSPLTVTLAPSPLPTAPGGDPAADPTGKALAERQAAVNSRARQLLVRNLAQAQTFRSFATVPGLAGTGGGNPTLNLSAVKPMTWISLGWWGTLGLASLASLGVLAVVWPRRKNAAPRPLLVLACTLFVLYAGYHTLMFARDMAS
jgi:hypothetical protein